MPQKYSSVLVHLQHHHHATRPRLHLLLLVLVYSCHEVSLAPLMAVASSEEAPDHCDFSLSSSMNMAEALLDGGCVCVLLLLVHDDNSTTTQPPRPPPRLCVCVCVSKSSKLVQARRDQRRRQRGYVEKKAVRTKE